MRIAALLFFTAAVLRGQAPAFEVASIKPADPPSGSPSLGVAMQKMVDMMPAGTIERSGRRVQIRKRTLLTLIAMAYRVKTTSIAGPAWMSDQLWDIDAKIPDDQPETLANEMLQNLLADRFGLKLHRETKEESGYALVVGKNGPKMKVSAPLVPKTEDQQTEAMANKAKEMGDVMRKQMKSGNTRPVGGSVQSYQSADMAQITTGISHLAQGPVVDETGLTGTYDVVLETRPDRDDQPGRTVFEAVDALGLKLVPRKVAIDKLVVDVLAKAPTAN